VAMTAASLAETLGMSPDALAEATTANFYRLFRKAAALDGVAAGEGAR
jgi:TatD DNase family protein